MSKDCCDKNPLQRDGTSQQQRLLKALLPGYVAVDERNMDDLIAFVTEYAREIQFYNSKNEEGGNWEKFFKNKKLDKTSKLTEPHYALFIAFLKLYKYAQDDLNQLTKKHIEFYYKDVLQLKEKPAVLDQVFIIFELAKHATSHKIDKGTQLKAGKDSSGAELIYETEREIVINKAQIAELKSLFYNKNNVFCKLSKYVNNHYCLYSSALSASSDGKGGELTTEDKSWKTFGLPVLIENKAKKKFTSNRDLADIGFAFASPNLFLAEGDRLITITITFKDDKVLKEIRKNNNYEINNIFKVKFSGEEEWIEAPKVDIDEYAENKALELMNNAKTWEDIAGVEPQDGPIFDDGSTGPGDQIDDYDIGEKVARKILIYRDNKTSKKIESIKELFKVYGFGIDKYNDVMYTFRRKYFDTQIIGNQLILKRTIFKYQPAIVKYNKEVLLDVFDTKWPLAKILIDAKSVKKEYIYKDLKKLNVAEVNVKVDVREVRNLILQNDFSMLDPAKPFQPFTNKPVLGSNFYIGSREVFQKKPDSLKLNLLWHKLPDNTNGFVDYYINYIDSYLGAERSNSSFKINMSYLDDKAWIPLKSETQLFTDETGTGLGNVLLPADKTVAIHAVDIASSTSIKRDEKLDEIKNYDESTQRGFMKLSLAVTDFGHSIFQRSYTKAVLVGLEVNENEKGEKDYTDKLPNEPYTPEIKELSLNYISTESFELVKQSASEFKNRVDQFFHIHPFGVEEIKTSNTINYLVPQIEEEGSLFIGVKDISPPQSLSLLFKVSEGSSDPDLPAQIVKWHYLKDNQWEQFLEADILVDSTNNLLKSGVISFSVSKTATSKNTILPSGFHWIKATVDNQSEAICDLISINSQAVTAKFKNINNDPNHLAKPLAGKTISKLKKSSSSISNVLQPYSSVGGQVVEKESKFYVRISERLRHKSRAITIWDYERLVLEKFPLIYKVKCLNHTKYVYASATEATCENSSESDKGIFVEMAPGNVTLIVISNVRNINAIDPLKPRTNLNTLNEISSYISRICSENVNLFVMNPTYEEIELDFKVRFNKQDIGYYKNQLNNDLKEFLAPWAYDSESDLVFGGKIHKSVILNFVEELEYVDFVTCFQMRLINKDLGAKTGDLEIADATSSASILTSVKTHMITGLETDDCDCSDNEQYDITTASRNGCSCDE